MPPRHFVVASFPDLQSFSGTYTQRNPGSCTDEVLEHHTQDGDLVAYQSLGLLQGWPHGDTLAFEAAMRRHSLVTRTLHRGRRGALMRFMARRPREVGSAAWLLHDAGTALRGPWMHVQDGEHTLRGPSADSESAQRCADQLGDEWGRQGIRCDVGVRSVSGPALRDWVELPAALHEFDRARPLASVA